MKLSKSQLKEMIVEEINQIIQEEPIPTPTATDPLKKWAEIVGKTGTKLSPELKRAIAQDMAALEKKYSNQLDTMLAKVFESFDFHPPLGPGAPGV